MSRAYVERDEILLAMGFASYKAYLLSSLWARIRSSVLKKADFTCVLCGERANEVHHTEYSPETLRGDKTDSLVALCPTCHELGEFSTCGRKVDLEEANRRLRLLSSRPASNETIEERRRRILGAEAAERLRRSDRAGERSAKKPGIPRHSTPPEPSAPVDTIDGKPGYLKRRCLVCRGMARRGKHYCRLHQP